MVAYDELIEIPYILACAAPSCEYPHYFFYQHWIDNDDIYPSQVVFKSPRKVNSLLEAMPLIFAVRLQSPPN